ncbi:ABC transporter ATP-binding protein [Glycomyces sp. NPDC021274]|uniref:ABC transporter ATP-binding protein n=1 Tax=Glycomyces sp. NPDC021274 TaxID=3155120 RepID=UPI0033E9F1D2
MKAVLRYAASGLRPRALLTLFLWSIPETLPTALFGLMVARALDDGFLAGRPWTGAAWLGGLMAAAAVGAFGTRGLYATLGATVEPFRDRLVRHVICHALHTSVAGRPDSGAVSRLARQVEIARDSYAGVVLAVRGCLVTAVGVSAGLLTLDPRLALFVLPPFLLGLFAFIATIGFAAARHRRAAEADERMAERVRQVAAAATDLAGCGGAAYGEAFTAGPIERLAAAERALAGAAALRAMCFAIGGWLPLLAVLAAAPWLADRGLTAGALTGALLYVLTGIQPALNTLVSGLGNSGLRLCVALGRILNDQPDTPATAIKGTSTPATPIDSAGAPELSDPHATIASGAVQFGHTRPRGQDEPDQYPGNRPPALTAQGLTFAYGPHAAPAVDDLDLTVPAGDHLAIIGPSGIGKSTLAGLLCGLLRPDAGVVAYGRIDADAFTPAELAHRRVLIPQEAYVFTGTARANLRYLDPSATDTELAAALTAVGAAALVDRLGGLDAVLDPRRLSAGERQLLALARAYRSPAPIAVLDEATCHLDPAAEARAEAAFAARGTLIVIAHRASSAMRARRLLVLDGERAAIGDHEYLRDTSPLYRSLLAHWGDEQPIAPESMPHKATAGPDRITAGQIQPAS